MESRIFSTDRYREIAKRTKGFLNGHEDFLSSSTARSTRAAGDAIESILGEHLREIVGEDCAERHGGHGLQRQGWPLLRD
jgi:hypothetical protein